MDNIIDNTIKEWELKFRSFLTHQDKSKFDQLIKLSTDSISSTLTQSLLAKGDSVQKLLIEAIFDLSLTTTLHSYLVELHTRLEKDSSDKRRSYRITDYWGEYLSALALIRDRSIEEGNLITATLTLRRLITRLIEELNALGIERSFEMTKALFSLWSKSSNSALEKLLEASMDEVQQL